jgi:DNA repair ATPase RecN
MDLMTGLSAISQTLAITKDLRNIDEKINIADFKLRLADLVERLLEAKEALQDAKEHERRLLDQIDLLTKKLNRKATLQDEAGRLYEVDSEGKKFGEPYCNLCFVRDEKLYRLLPWREKDGKSYRCGNCKSFYHVNRVFALRPSLSDLGRDLA